MRRPKLFAPVGVAFRRYANRIFMFIAILRESMEAPLRKKSPPKIIAKWVDSLAIK
jgi:hypothetical protein